MRAKMSLADPGPNAISMRIGLALGQAWAFALKVAHAAYNPIKTPQDELEIHRQLITAACTSVADTTIHPMQDELGLNGGSRMNLPGVGEGYWEWRFDWEQVKPVHAKRLVQIAGLYGR